MTSTDASRPQPPAAPDAGAAMPFAPDPPAGTAPLAAGATATLERPRAAMSESRSRMPTALLMKLLKMADAYAAAGATRVATDLYFTIVERHGETPQADRAQQRLMDIAQRYESAGGVRQARAIYERLL